MEPNRVSTPQGSHAAPAAHTARSKVPVHGSAQAAPDEAGGGAGGFLSLLSALGSNSEAPLLAADGAPPSVPDAGTLVPWLGGNAADGATGTPGQGGVLSALTQGASTLSLAGAGASGGAGALTGALAALGAEAVPSGGLVAQTALLDNAIDKPAQEGTNPLAGYRRAFSRMQGALSQSLSGMSTTALAAGHRSVAGDKSLASASLAAAPGMQVVPERRDAAIMAAAAVPRALPEAAVSLALTPLATAASAPEVPFLARTSQGGAALGAAVEAWGSANYGPENAPLTEAGSSVPEPSQAGAEDALAEQVAYWVSENLQNAELTVTHDGKPVEVSVSMSGKEAHIVFGSDQSETRDLLDASVAQLRDLLHSEGLVLSGVTVGGSGARNAASEEGDTPRGRQGARQAQVLVPMAELGAARPGILTDRAVDVFV